MLRLAGDPSKSTLRTNSKTADRTQGVVSSRELSNAAVAGTYPDLPTTRGSGAVM